MKKCVACNKNISEFSEVCPYCGANQNETSASTKNGFRTKAKPVHNTGYCAVGAGVICILLGVLSVLADALPIMHEIPPTSIFARFKAFKFGDIVYMAMFAFFGVSIIRRKKDWLLIVVSAAFSIWQCTEQFKWLKPLFRGDFRISYIFQFLLPVAFCAVMFLAIWHYCRSKKQSQLLWKLPFFVAVICLVLNAVWLVLSHRSITIIEVIWVPLLAVGSYLFGKWIKAE